MYWSGGMAYDPPCRASYPFRWLILVCKRLTPSFNNHGAAKRVPDEDDTLHVILLQIGEPGQDIQGAFRQDVGVTVTQPQGGDLVPLQHVREPGIGALAGPAEAPPCATHPYHPVRRLRSRMQERLDVTPVCPQQHTLSQLAGVWRTGADIVETNREGVRVVRA